ncbi:swp82p [Saccharomyces arboricola H-6]|uniref:Swp82p n=1 Tax=Saccharomyces arboricola (strain H-6 / AS 2.3317 / CBS 10644) TaxID=1160507 RepID=J8Q2M9_SACAR|nr:swp82p [Saccharomyces arboricola H-6]
MLDKDVAKTAQDEENNGSPKQGELGAVFMVPRLLIKEHERIILKQILQILEQDELVQAPLDEFPYRNIRLPRYTDGSKTKDATDTAYEMIQKDVYGEKKIGLNGEQFGGRHYLFNTFTFTVHRNVLMVLLQDVIKVLYQDDVKRDENEFVCEHDQFLIMETTEEQTSFLTKKGILSEGSSGPFKYITAKSAFVEFGASVIVGGQRIVDDYWETLAKKQNLSSHQRVFKLTTNLISKISLLRPSFQNLKKKNDNQVSIDASDKGKNTISSFKFESPYPIVTEQPSGEIREAYIENFAKGEHISAIVPGQSISGTLELSAQFRVPRYHSKNSFQQALQMKAMDIPIGKHEELLAQYESQTPEGSTPNSLPNNIPSVNPSNKPIKRMLSSILDSNVSSSKNKKSEENEIIKPISKGLLKNNTSLNIDGWKFESLPLKSAEHQSKQQYYRGLPLYEKSVLLESLKQLTPNEIKELEHLHDAVFVNTGLQNVRKVRTKKWKKYWQYKAGIPIGLKRSQLSEFQNQYLKDVLEQTSVTTTFNEVTNTDETITTKRIPNANFLGNCNIKDFKPPYIYPHLNKIPQNVIENKATVKPETDTKNINPNPMMMTAMATKPGTFVNFGNGMTTDN